MKQIYEDKRVIKIVGQLDKNEDGRYIVTVTDKEEIKEYDLVDILNDMCGYEISLSSESSL